MSAGISDAIWDEIFGNSSVVRKKHDWNFRTNREMVKLLSIGDQFSVDFIDEKVVENGSEKIGQLRFPFE